MQRPTHEIAATHIIEKAPPGMKLKPQRRGNGLLGSGTNRQHSLTETSVKNQDVRRIVKQDYETKSQKVTENLEVEISALRAHTAHLPHLPVDAWQREVNIRNALLASKTAELQQKTAIANAFFGSDPRDKSFTDFVQKAKTIDKLIWPGAQSTQLWEQSYRAAHEVQLLAQSIALLHQQAAQAQHFLQAAKAEENTRLVEQAQAQRLAAQRSRAEIEQRRQKGIAETAGQQKEQDERHAREQTRLADAANAQRLARDKARAATAAAERAVAAEQGRVQAQPNGTAEPRDVATSHQAQRQAHENRRQQALRAEHAAIPTFAGPAGIIGVSPATALALKAALRTAVSATTTAISTAAAPVIVGIAALLVPSRLGNSDLYSVSVALSELASVPTTDLHERAATGQEIDLPVTLGWRTIGNRAEIVVAATNGVTIPSNVPVKLAHFDTRKNAYVSVGGVASGPVMTWTPQAEPLNPSTDLPSADNDPPVYEGATVTPIAGRIDPNPRLDLYGFGGQITVFPIDSGLPPIFTLFRDRRQDPGVASGIGQPVSGDWLRATSTLEGAPIPKQIADKLRGREFSNFGAFRRAFWKALGADPVLNNKLSALNKVRVKKGLSAIAPQVDSVGKRRKYELHHVMPISKNGAVYDVDNIQVLVPRQHIKNHAKNREQLQ